MTTPSSNLIEFFDQPPRAPRDRTPRIIGRLTAAGVAVLDSVPDQGTADDAYSYKPNPVRDFEIKSAGQLAEYEKGLSVVIKDLSHYALPRFGLRNNEPFFSMFAYNSDIEPPLAPKWHRDQPETEAESVGYMIGGQNRKSNTEYAAIAVPISLLPFDYANKSKTRSEGLITDFLKNAGALSQIGSNEILEFFGDTPHRSSVNRTGLKRFGRYDFNMA